MQSTKNTYKLDAVGENRHCSIQTDSCEQK